MRYRITAGVYEEDVHKLEGLPLNKTTVIIDGVHEDQLDASLLDLSDRMDKPFWKAFRWFNIAEE